MENTYKPNSNKFKEEQSAAVEEKKVEKIISGEVKVRKKSGFRKMMDNFISDDVPNIRTYICKDVVVPTIKKIISETVDIALFGRSRGSGRSLADKVSYNKYYKSDYTPVNTVNTRTGYGYNEIVLESRGEAERVLSQMNDLIETYDMVSVADLYDLVGITGEYTDNRYGWTNIRNANIRRVSDGFLLEMPKALPIK